MKTMIETREVIAEIKGDDNKSIAAKFDEIAYSPAFGTVDGLITDGDFEVIEL